MACGVVMGERRPAVARAGRRVLYVWGEGSLQ